MEKRPQNPRKDPKTGGYSIIKGRFHRRLVQGQQEPVNKHREPNWSVDTKATRIVTTIIILAFAVLVIGAVLS